MDSGDSHERSHYTDEWIDVKTEKDGTVIQLSIVSAVN